MCLSKPSIPTPKPLQEVKTPDAANMRARRTQRAVGASSGTLLTGPSGVGAAAMNTGANTLLGG